LVPAAKVGQICITNWLQPLTALTLDNRLTTAAAGRSPQVVSRRIFGESTVYLFGELPLNGAATTIEITIPRPANWFAAALKEALSRAGIQVDGKARSVRWPEGSVVTNQHVKLGQISSPPLGELVRAFMKPSQNLETDLVFDHVGELSRTAKTPAWRTSEALAVTALGEFLRENKLPADEVHFDEGSGLSRNNLTSANATVALLRFMSGHREADAFVNSLPIAGVDGTLKRRMKATAAEGNVRAKTGSLRYANSLSGYVTTAAGERLIFSLMLNRNTQQPAGRNVRAELDDIAVLLANLASRSDAAVEGSR
jgi:D-alanyl-D-alanine carboxypeptidase/D-alanyl-D-alanine-endopeptidase (penicillin-binding protein 4)